MSHTKKTAKREVLLSLLSSLEDRENSQIKNTLLKILYLGGNESFNQAIIHSSSEIEQLEEGGNDIKLFGIGYKITKKTGKFGESCLI